MLVGVWVALSLCCVVRSRRVAMDRQSLSLRFFIYIIFISNQISKGIFCPHFKLKNHQKS